MYISARLRWTNKEESNKLKAALKTWLSINKKFQLKYIDFRKSLIIRLPGCKDDNYWLFEDVKNLPLYFVQEERNSDEEKIVVCNIDGFEAESSFYTNIKDVVKRYYFSNNHYIIVKVRRDQRKQIVIIVHEIWLEKNGDFVKIIKKQITNQMVDIFFKVDTYKYLYLAAKIALKKFTEQK